MRAKKKRAVLVLNTLAVALATACSDPVETEQPITPPAEVDDEFDQGSRIADQEPTPTQIENLALLGKVWGFAKYHHPLVVEGSRNWDYELFRIMPAILEAPDRAAAAAALVTWLDGVGEVPACGPCAQLPGGAPLQPDNAWIEDAAVLGPALSERLMSMYQNRPVRTWQRYISFTQNVGNPDFSAEDRYTRDVSPDAGYRALALFRFWNIIQYWFPYRDVMEEDWEAVLREFIPIMMAPLSQVGYRLELIRLIGRVHDTHANIWSDIRFQPPEGNQEAPLILRFVEGRLVVTGYTHNAAGPATGLEIGDEIHFIDGRSVESLVDSLRPYYPASNEPTRLRDIARKITRGTGPIVLEGAGTNGAFSVTFPRVPIASLDLAAAYVHDLPGPTFRMLSDSVAYLKLSSTETARATDYIQQALGAQVLVIDIRNYPNQFMVFALGGHLVGAAEPFARFTTADPNNPGAFVSTPPVVHTPREPRFTGKVVILVDEVTQSSAEYTAMAFRVAPGAIVAGSTTAGADGNVSRIPLPGGAEGMISGIGVFYPDGRPTQRIGIIPDLVVRPTIEGIRLGRDEVLEAGVSHALGREFRMSRQGGAN